MHAYWSSYPDLRSALVLALGVLALSLVSCTTPQLAQPSAEMDTPITTGRVYSLMELRQRIPSMYFGDDSYAEVNSAWLQKWYHEYRSQLSRVGIVNWNERFDCNRFVEFYTGLAQAYYFRESFHRQSPAHALALGPIWYTRDNGRTRHALVQAITERGRVFFDPQNGREVELTPAEQASAYLMVF
jgi:hypothetical protein